MSASPLYADRNDTAYMAAFGHFQKGEWQPGLAELDSLAKRFPQDTNLRATIAEHQVRAKIDQDEHEDRRRVARRLAVRWAVRLALLVVVAFAGQRALESYADLIRQQAGAAQVAAAAQVRAFELATKYADAQSMLRAGRLAEAQVLLNEIVAVDPAYPGLEVLLGQANARNTLETQYNLSVGLVERGDWAGALPLLQSISTIEPGYKNVEELQALVERQLLLEDMWGNAQTPYAGQSWVEAGAAYEGIRAIDPDYRRADVEDRLFECYVNAGRQSLAGQEDSLVALQTAEAYFRKALALRPQDPKVKTERELARLYLLSQADFADGRWTDVIVALEVVYAADKGYANGSARQALYEAYVARGTAAMDGQQYEAALSDYQVAVALAEKDDQSVLRLYEAYLRAGDAYGAQEDFEPAVLMYRKAVEAAQLAPRAETDPILAEALRQADEAVGKGNFSLAYEKYQAVFHGADTTQATITHVVQPGEYLILIATRYRSTVQAIAQANKIQNPSRIYPGQELVIPVAP
jgi:tetratricopeptide (TPR) repeat protein